MGSRLALFVLFHLFTHFIKISPLWQFYGYLRNNRKLLAFYCLFLLTDC